MGCRDGREGGGSGLSGGGGVRCAGDAFGILASVGGGGRGESAMTS